MMVKGILFLTAAAVILRFGRGMFADMRGIAWRMPYTFGAAAIAIVAMSGLPPLAGFGAKWLLLSALIEKGWYGQVAVGVLATFVGFLYMARFILAAFLPRPAVHQSRMDAPMPILVTQYLLITGILVISFYPKLVISQISAAIDPYFASTLVWEGMSLEMIYGHWNPIPVMGLAVIASAILWAVLLLLQRTGSTRLAHRSDGRPRESCSFRSRLLSTLRGSDASGGPRVLERSIRGDARHRGSHSQDLHRQRSNLLPVHPLLRCLSLHHLWRLQPLLDAQLEYRRAALFIAWRSVFEDLQSGRARTLSRIFSPILLNFDRHRCPSESGIARDYDNPQRCAGRHQARSDGG